MSVSAVLSLAPFAGLLFILPFPSTVALRLLCLAAAFAIAMFSWRRLAVPTLPARPVLLVWAAVAFASLAFAVDPAYSLGEIKNEVGYAMMAFVAFFAITGTVRELRLWSRVVVAAAAVISLWAVAAGFKPGAWIDGGAYGGVGTFASLAVVAAPLLLLAWGGLSARGRTSLAVSAVVILAASVFSQQRILWAAFAIELVAAMVLLRSAGFLKISRVALAASIVGSVALAGAALMFVHAQKTELSTPEIQVLEKDFRLAHWQRVLARIQEHPVTGAGFGRETMKKAYPDLVPKTSPESLLWHPHNVFLTYGIAMGWPGMLALLAVFAALLRAYWKHLDAEDTDHRLAAIAGVALVLGVVTRNLTNDFFVRDGALMFWALNGALLGYLGRSAATMRGAA